MDNVYGIDLFDYLEVYEVQYIEMQVVFDLKQKITF
jgi:hypothetical protein